MDGQGQVPVDGQAHLGLERRLLDLAPGPPRGEIEAAFVHYSLDLPVLLLDEDTDLAHLPAEPLGDLRHLFRAHVASAFPVEDKADEIHSQVFRLLAVIEVRHAAALDLNH